MITAQEVFERSVRPLPARERLRLATLILEELSQGDVQLVESGDAWSEQDQQDLMTFSLHYVATAYPEDEELV